MKKIIKSGIFILFIYCLSDVNAQIVIHGKAIDNDSGDGIPFASVQIVNTALGTACDENGEFVLKIDPEFYDGTLKVSCIGYSNAILAIQDLKDSSEEEITIRLEPYIGYLDEIVITGSRKSPEDFLKEAFNSIPANYIQQPFNTEIYSKISVVDSINVVLYQIESILLTYREGYVSGARNYSKLLQKRETGNIPSPFHDYVKDNNEYFPYTPGLDIAAVDQIGWGEESFTVFNPKIFRKMEFKYDGVSIYDQDTVVAIEYSGKRLNGKIYIASNNLAIIKHSFKWGNNNQEIIYKNVIGYYFPYRITTKVPALHNKTIYLVDEIIIKNIVTDNVEPLEKKFDQWYPKGVPFDKEYWNSNYPIKK